MASRSRPHAMIRQRTLKRSWQVKGIGLHTGVSACVTLEPAEADHGVQLVRVDMPGARPCPVTIDHVVDTRHATSIGTGSWRVGTVEHLMAALYGCEIDNVLVMVDGPEIPILDGSAQPFVDLIDTDGGRELSVPRRRMRLTTPVRVQMGPAWLEAEPAEVTAWDCTIDFDHPLIGTCRREVVFDRFREAVAPARTFSLLRDVDRLRAEGLARGGALENAVVLGKDGWLNPDGVRFEDEPLRHKILDMVGDTALLGTFLVARIRAFLPGHTLTCRWLRRLHAGRARLLEPWFGQEPGPRTGG